MHEKKYTREVLTQYVNILMARENDENQFLHLRVYKRNYLSNFRILYYIQIIYNSDKNYNKDAKWQCFKAHRNL